MTISFKPNLKVLPSSQQKIWDTLSEVPSYFTLYGGTAIALQLGHRESIDFDFFTDKPIEVEALLSQIIFLRDVEITQQDQNTLSVIVEAPEPVHISFFGSIKNGRIKEPLIAEDNGIKVASLIDLFAFKLKVILQRSESKDYLDIAELLKTDLTIGDGLAAAKVLFGNGFPIQEALKAITYFEDGDLSELSLETREQLIQSVDSVGSDLPTILKLSEHI